MSTLADTLDFSTKVNFNMGVVAAGEAQIEDKINQAVADSTFVIYSLCYFPLKFPRLCRTCRKRGRRVMRRILCTITMTNQSAMMPARWQYGHGDDTDTATKRQQHDIVATWNNQHSNNDWHGDTVTWNDWHISDAETWNDWHGDVANVHTGVWKITCLLFFENNTTIADSPINHNTNKLPVQCKAVNKQLKLSMLQIS